MTDLFLGEHVPDGTTAVANAIGPEPDATLERMEADARREGFPIVGPAVGGWLSQLARIHGAKRVFEFGSGFGYSAYWFLRALPADGEVVLTDMEPDNLDRAETFLAAGGFGDRATFEVGDAVETARSSEGPFDIALLDIEKYQYADGFDAIRAAIPPGGMVVADNIMTAGREQVDDTVEYDAFRQVVTGEAASLAETDVSASARRGTAGVLDYLEAVRGDPEFETTLLPLGDGVTVTTRVRR